MGGFFLGMCGWGFILQEILWARLEPWPRTSTRCRFTRKTLSTLCDSSSPPVGGFTEQDCLLPRHLAVRQERHRREGGSPSRLLEKVRSHDRISTFVVFLKRNMRDFQAEHG